MKQSHKIQALAEFIAAHPELSIRMPTIRKWIKYADDNGASKWVRRVGRRIFVDVDKFFEWTKRKV